MAHLGECSVWVCRHENRARFQFSGFGDTPDEAYRDWKKLNT